ncbi:MAG: glycoside hydrolase family 88 protein, partial [Bacteroidota bacterium]
KVEREPNYSGGLSIDHEDVNTLYLSVNRDSVFEIERWETSDMGKSWQHKALTSGSSKNNIRPFAVRNARKGNPLQVLWVANSFYAHYTRYQSAIQTSLPFEKEKIDLLSTKGIMDICGQVADWQILNPVRLKRYKDYRHQGIDWVAGAFHTGLWAYYKGSGETVFRDHIRSIGYNYGWRPSVGIFNADNHTFFQQAIALYKEEPRKAYIRDIRYVMDIHLARDPNGPENLYHNRKDNPYHHEWWTWCDALYMSPPTFARMYDLTGQQKYLDYAIKYWKKTGDYLYSPSDSLYFRDYNYFDKLTENGKKIFWSRGNGWVLAGLARFIPFIPEDHPDRAYFVDQFKAMAAKLAQIQDQEDGMWRVSLLDPAYLDQGESSGTAFFTWGIAWGINYGLLDEATFRPVVEKSWKALCGNVNDEGRLGYVQQIAASPYPFYDYQYHLYASGAFLGAGMEMVKLIL